MPFTADDFAYVRTNFLTLDELCANRAETPDQIRALAYRRLLPGPAYVTPEGTEFVAPDYLELADEAGGPERLQDWFQARFDANEADEQWDAYLTGIYAVCLREVTPETIARKSALVDSLRALLADPRPDDSVWSERLRAEVDELDELERPFSPHYDRERFARPPTRDELVAEPRERYPDVFAAERTVPT